MLTALKRLLIVSPVLTASLLSSNCGAESTPNIKRSQFKTRQTQNSILLKHGRSDFILRNICDHSKSSQESNYSIREYFFVL